MGTLTKLENPGDSDLGRDDDELGLGHAKWKCLWELQIEKSNRVVSVRNQGKRCSELETGLLSA